ncbi:hypothetical protein PND83_18865 [Flavonifractor plautii]|uniref:Uncharacterized protein n=1 Tax=Flavonifractor plautii TaxID=292800 RepID=A0AAW6C7H9_FLAPL|nr:hypothetical protein [Flavonifractor plautii]MDB7890161.1 hypothetical protein [Flavonifractor plautii]MDB7908050.1 hypothetical protein [Flavonifractor plautii]
MSFFKNQQTGGALLKRIFAFFLSILLILGICPMSALADTGGSGNVDGGGGSMGQGTSQNSWNPGMDGVRVTVIYSETQKPASASIDLTSKTPAIKIHFGKVSKIQYRDGSSISPTTSSYVYYNPAITMPRIISTGSSKASIEAIKKYFCDEIIVRYIAELTGISYDDLITGKYKLLLEPIAYFKHNGVMYAMTAHEAALYDNQTGGALRRTMTSLTHKNLPLAMYLEYSDLGFAAYSGPTNKTCSNDTIIAYLGMGIVRFEEQPPEQPEPTDYDYEYRVDTDVITPVTLYAGSEINPDGPATVTFTIKGSTYRMSNIVIPEGDSQLAWVKWHTPSEPQDITITVRTNRGALSQTTIKAKVVDLSGNDPPDPKATDTAGSWRPSSVPSREEKSYAAWSVWWAQWHPYWVWHSTGDGDGYWVDEGWYDFFRDNYSASMTATTRIEPDEKVPTAAGDTMKSGYGVSNTVTATVSTSAPMSHYTYGQTAVSYFPEFNYTTYWRLLDRLSSGRTARFQFAENIYSTYKQRVHFSPVWFPDGSYTVNTHVMDIWTPAGMLCANLTDSVTISGSLYDDWHIAPGNP